MLNFIGYQGITNAIYFKFKCLCCHLSRYEEVQFQFGFRPYGCHIKITGPCMAPGKWVRARWPLPLQMLRQSTPSHALGSSDLGSPRKNLLTVLFNKSKTQTQRPPQHLAFLFPAGRAQRTGPGETVRVSSLENGDVCLFIGSFFPICAFRDVEGVFTGATIK